MNARTIMTLCNISSWAIVIGFAIYDPITLFATLSLSVLAAIYQLAHRKLL